MPRRSSNTFSLVRKRIRPSFNKANVYNAATWEKNANRNTQYRQVFFAKQETRSYHGEHLTETQFRNVFKPENTSVSPLQNQRNNQQGEVPHAMQTFTALERRLDFAVFRSLFSSSVRQAAQFIVGGAVKVNGVKISSPSYQLQAGDVFSVDPNRVLEALGRTKPSVKESVDMTNRIIRKYNKHLDRCRSNPEKMFALRERLRLRHQVHSAKHNVSKQRRVEAHNAALKTEMNNKFMELQPQPVLSRILSGNLQSASEVVRGKINQVINLVKADKFGSETISEQDLDADKSPVDPLKGKPHRADPQTAAEQSVEADNSPVDPLKGKPSRADPQTIAEQDLDADKSPVDPLNGKNKANPQTIAEQDLDADKSPIDPLKGKNRSDPQTISEQDLDADKSPEDPLSYAQKHPNPETSSEADIDADNSPIDPLPEDKKASHLHREEPHKEATASEEVVGGEKSNEDPLKSKGAYSASEAEELAAKYTVSEARPPSRKNILRLVDEIIKDTRLEIRESYHSRMIDISAPAPYDPSWVERLPEKVQEVAADMAEEDLANLKIALPWSTTGKLYGLSDPTKRWFTPWTPRQFIAPMAVLPHHIEVDFETCHAVYLRDPVARPNQSEVVSPFSLEMHERAHMWYFYRRRKNLSRL